MFKQPRNLLWLLPLLLIVTSPVWKPPVAAFLKPRGDMDAKMGPSDLTSRKFTMDSLVITMSENGAVEWVINAKKAYTGADDHHILMDMVDAEYRGHGREKTLINSKHGSYDVDKRHLMLSEDVIIKKPAKHHVMYTELLHYYDATKMAVSPGKVTIKAPDLTIVAGRLDYDLSSDAYDLSNHVTCEF